MSNNYFKFKQFTINQNLAAMKVGTDGVLLGAWTKIPQTGSVLDVGTGTALIALMLAQRNQNIKITALEIDEMAALDAKENVANSPWHSRIQVINNSLQKFTALTTNRYALIVSNPPFFNATKPSPNTLRNTARQTTQLTTNELLNCSAKLLSNDGTLSLILPHNLLEHIQSTASKLNLFAKSITLIKPTPEKAPHRFLTQFSFNRQKTSHNELIIESNGRHQYSEAYKELTCDFYLNEEEKINLRLKRSHQQ